MAPPPTQLPAQRISSARALLGARRPPRLHHATRPPPPPPAAGAAAARDATARHRRPKPPLWAFALLFVIAALAMAGGVGGGGLFVPLLSLGLGCTPHEATALSQALICGASFGALASNAHARHPTADRPLIDLRVVAFLGPAEMAGALVGVLLNKTLPSLVILMAMALVLSATAVQTCRKGAARLAADSRRLERLGGGGDAAVEPEGIEKGLLKPKTPAKAPPPPPPSPRRRRQHRPPPPRPPRPRRPDDGVVAHSAACSRRPSTASHPATRRVAWISSPPTLPCRGRSSPARRRMARIGRAAPRARRPRHALAARAAACGPAYWALSAVGFSLLLVVSTAAGRRLVASSRARRAAGVAPADGDVDWGAPLAAACMRLTLAAGVVAGLMGVGGGLLLGPLMIHLGVPPPVSAATTATMILLTSSSAARAVAVGGRLPIELAPPLALTTLCGAYAGKQVIGRLVRRYRATSLITLVLAALVAASAVAIGATGAVELAKEDDVLATLVLRSPC